MRYTDDVLQSLRAVGDPAPDALIAALAQSDQIDDVNRILHQLILNAQTIPEALPDDIENWLRDTDRLPAEADPARLERAAALFVEYGLTMTLILATASFLECYAAYPGVKVMTFTYRLGQNAYRRVAETAQFLLLVMSPGGLLEHGQAIPAIQKVRLMHSAIRHFIRRTGQWDEAELGVPICQEDMLGTLMCLSAVVVEHMRKLGLDLSEQQAEDFWHLWRVVGQMLGCQPEHLPRSMAEAMELTDAIRRHTQRASPDGVHMTQALLEMHADLVPGEAFDGLVPAVMRHLAGDQIADWLEVPRSHWDAIVKGGEGLARVFDRFDRRAGRLADLVDQLGLTFVSRQAIALAGYERAAFAIPTSLQDAWRLDERRPSGQ